MQSNVVKAFRQRLVRAGFTSIYISRLRGGKYSLICKPPKNNSTLKALSEGGYICRELTELQMNALPRVVWFE